MMRLPPLRLVASTLGLAAALAAGSAEAQQQLRAPTPPPAPAPAPAATPAQRPAAAPTAPQPLPPKGSLIVVVDPPTIEREATAFQAVRTQQEKMLTAQQSEITRMEKDLRAVDEELNKQRTILTPDAYTQKRRDLDKRFADAQQKVQNGRRDIEQAVQDAYNKVVRQMLDIVAEIVAENDYKIVVARPQLIASQNSLDISGEIASRLNKKMPTVAVATPK